MSADITCTGCSKKIPATAAFCPWCGGKTEQIASMTLDEALGRWQLHRGHDFRRDAVDESGATVAVFWLGIAENALQAMMKVLPGHRVIEHRRGPAAGYSSDWLRVDIVPAVARE